MVLSTTLGAMRSSCAGSDADGRLLEPVLLPARGSLVAVPALVAAPLTFVVLLAGRWARKIFGLFPAIARFRRERNERWYYTLMMSTGLTFGTTLRAVRFTHGIVTRGAVLAPRRGRHRSAVIPTMIANAFFLPRHLSLKPEADPYS